jgi:hypothetical protein
MINSRRVLIGLKDQNQVKLVHNQLGYALYVNRSPAVIYYSQANDGGIMLWRKRIRYPMNLLLSYLT